MKLKKIIPYMDSMTNARLYIDEGVVWEGHTLSLQVAAGPKEKRKIYLEECREDQDYKSINEVLAADKYLNYKLDADNIDYEAISTAIFTNEHGAKLIRLDISLLPNLKNEN